MPSRDSSFEDELKKELSALGDVDLDDIPDINNDVTQMIVTKLCSEYKIFSEVSQKQAKLLLRVGARGYFARDPVCKWIYDEFFKVMVSLERKGRTRMEEIAMPPSIPSFSGRMERAKGWFNRRLGRE